MMSRTSSALPPPPPAPLRRRRPSVVRLGLLTTSLAVAGAATLAGPTSPAASAVGDDCPETFPVEDVAADQAVTGLTVSSGQDVEEFTGTVIGVLEDGIAPGLPMIMVRAQSAEIDRVGGIWAGMSGSPVYTDDGRLLGAVAYGLAANSPVAGITPAAAMYDVVDAEGAAAPAPERVALPRRLQREVVAEGDVSARAASAGMRRLPTPVMVSGMGAAGRLNKAAKRMDLADTVFFRAGAAAAAPVSAEEAGIEPGGSLGASLSYGDFSAVGIGTVTAVCGADVVGFGHPMQFSGATTMTMHGADTLYVQEDSLWGPFKVANPTGPVGSILQDRLAGIGGPIGDAPATTTITSSATSSDTGFSRTGTTYGTVEELMPDIAALGVVANHTRVLDKAGSGSAAMSFTISGTTGSGAEFSVTRVNKAASEWDVAYMSPEELYGTLSVLQRNGYTDVTIDDVTMDATLDEDLALYDLGAVQVRRGGSWKPVKRRAPLEAAPGSTLKLRVGLVPVVGDDLEAASLRLDVPVPQGLARTGEAELTLSSGQTWISRRDVAAGSFAKMLRAIEDRTRTDQVSGQVRAGRRASGAEVASAPADAVVQGYRSFWVVADGGGDIRCRGC